MTPQQRDFFDEHLEFVLGQLPASVHRLIDEVPLIVDDRPTPDTMAKLGVRHSSHLCGLFTGVPLTHRTVNQSGTLPNQVKIYREGILSLSADRHGAVEPTELRRQIRITILHELGHHHGLGEEELEAMGY